MSPAHVWNVVERDTLRGINLSDTTTENIRDDFPEVKISVGGVIQMTDDQLRDVYQATEAYLQAVRAEFVTVFSVLKMAQKEVAELEQFEAEDGNTLPSLYD